VLFQADGEPGTSAQPLADRVTSWVIRYFVSSMEPNRLVNFGKLTTRMLATHNPAAQIVRSKRQIDIPSFLVINLMRHSLWGISKRGQVPSCWSWTRHGESHLCPLQTFWSHF